MTIAKASYDFISHSWEEEHRKQKRAPHRDTKNRCMTASNCLQRSRRARQAGESATGPSPPPCPTSRPKMFHPRQHAPSLSPAGIQRSVVAHERRSKPRQLHLGQEIETPPPKASFGASIDGRVVSYLPPQEQKKRRSDYRSFDSNG